MAVASERNTIVFGRRQPGEQRLTEEDRRIAGRYRLITRIGGGAMGVVWQGQDSSLDRVVAVKELLLQNGLDAAKTAEARSRVMREGRIAARLQHPHAITVFDVVEDSGRPWLIMEYLPSESLAAVLSAKGTLPPEDVVRIGRQLASALTAAHKAGIVHRDVKPGNVLLGEEGTVKITDFGISRAAGDVTITATGEIAGTPAFLAPEVARGHEADFRSDVFSLGATLYTAVEGVPPYGWGENPMALLHRVAREDVTPPQRAGVLTPVLTRLLQAKPEDRPSMAQTLAMLDELPLGPAPAVPAVTASDARKGGGGRRKGLLLALVAGGVLVVAAVLALVLNGTGDQPGAPASPPAAAPPSSAAPSTPQQSTQQSPPPSSSAAETPAASTPERAVAEYYALLPGNLEAGYARLTQRFKQERSRTFASYQGFWSQMRAVNVGGLTARGDNTVSADVTYVYANGRTVHEHHVYTLVQQNGGWAIDSQRSG